MARSIPTAAQTVHYVYDRQGHGENAPCAHMVLVFAIIAEHDGSTGQVLREYVWLDDMPLALVTGPVAAPQFMFIHAGQLDEPLMVTDMARAKLWDVANDPWGDALSLATPANHCTSKGE